MKTQIKSLQQFNAHLDFITEKHEAFMLDLSETASISYRVTDLPLILFKEIADFYDEKAIVSTGNSLTICLLLCEGTMFLHVYSVNVKACINYEEA